MNKNPNIKTLDTYLSLCTEVYDLSKPNPPADAYAFYEEYVKAANGAILEPMCGTGRFLIPLLENGFNVHGFDASDNMLESLHAKAKAKKLKANIWREFAQDLARPEKYELIFIPSGSFCVMTNLRDVKQALQKFYEHLNDDGIFLFEAETLKALPREGLWRESVWHKEDGRKIMLSGLSTMQEGVCTTICKYELIEEGSIIHTEIEELKVRIYEQAELLAILKAAGFNDVRPIKAFDSKKQPNEQDESIVYECKK